MRIAGARRRQQLKRNPLDGALITMRVRLSLFGLLLGTGACATVTRTTGAPDAETQRRSCTDSTCAAVTGFIWDAKAGTPMAGANVYLATGTWYPPNTPYAPYTDTNGRFRIDLILPGHYIVVVRRINYLAQRHTWKARAGRVDTLQFRLRIPPLSHCTGIDCY